MRKDIDFFSLMQNLLKYGATVITLPTCRSAIRAATSCNKEDQPMTSPHWKWTIKSLSDSLQKSSEIHEFPGQLGSNRSLFPDVSIRLLGTPSGFPRNVVPRSHARKPIFRANSERLGQHPMARSGHRNAGPKFLRPQILGAPESQRWWHPASSSWGLGILYLFYSFLNNLSASAIFMAVGLQIDLRFWEAGLICCRLWRWCSTLGETLGTCGLI